MSIDESIGWARNWIAVVDDEIARMRSSGNHDIALAMQAGQKHLRYLIVAAQQPAAHPVADDVVRDAERYRWLRDEKANIGLVIDKRVGESPRGLHGEFNGWDYEYRAGEELDAAIDAAILAAQQQKGDK